MRRFGRSTAPLCSPLSAFVLALVFIAVVLRSAIPVGYMPEAPAQKALLPGFVICHGMDPADPAENGKRDGGTPECPFALINRLAMATADALPVIAVARSRCGIPYVLPPQCACDRRAVSAFLARGPPPLSNGNPTEKA